MTAVHELSREVGRLCARIDDEVASRPGTADAARGFRSGLLAAKLSLLDEQARHAGQFGRRGEDDAAERVRKVLTAVASALGERAGAVDASTDRGAGFREGIERAHLIVAAAHTPS
ncbi:hypothetical protein [Rhodococcus sp. HNM0569]|uniref:hypothetical protein n=1 Tax=Rhodococcus sp. HNM0569 TaxID=2716340 RepID=UPI00146AD5FE|nr:hypothetical protein [Rhodococcus sp. HNM0569]NLU83191.1 hypothetical protein [Rhodococcus sp. HNM0569]